MTQRWAPLLVICSSLLALVGCGKVAPKEGYLVAAVQLTASTSITRVSLDVSPAGISQDLTYNASLSSFVGTLTVPVGNQTLTAKAWAGTTVVGTGIASVTVVKGQTVQASITILDNTGPATLPFHSPVITSFVIPASAQAGDVMSVNATAFDQDGDPITFAWSAAPSGCAAFANAASASTTASAVTTGTCTLTVVATARGKSDTRSGNLVISAATGTISITGVYVPYPRITEIDLIDGTTTLFAITRTGSDATFHTPLVETHAYTLTVHFDSVADGTLALSSNCGGTFVQPTLAFPATVASGTWTSPSAPGPACVVTATLTRQGLADSFPIVVIVP